MCLLGTELVYKVWNKFKLSLYVNLCLHMMHCNFGFWTLNFTKCRINLGISLFVWKNLRWRKFNCVWIRRGKLFQHLSETSCKLSRLLFFYAQIQDQIHTPVSPKRAKRNYVEITVKRDGRIHRNIPCCTYWRKILCGKWLLQRLTKQPKLN